MIAVTATFDPQDRDLRDKLAADAATLPGRPTPESFIAQQFIDAFARLGLFRFEPGPGSGGTQLALHLSSGAGPRRWPNADVTLEISLAGEPPISMVLFRRAHCGAAPCSPTDLADPTWYAQLFEHVIRQWPRGMFKHIVLTTTAHQEPGGQVRTVESVTEFGQRGDNTPSALFELMVGDDQIPIALCRDAPHQRWRGLGRYQGRSLPPEYEPSCWIDGKPAVVLNGNGTLTLVRAFLRTPL